MTMHTQITCTFKVPESEEDTIWELNGKEILWNDVLDPKNVYFDKPTDVEGVTARIKLDVNFVRAIVVNYYQESVLPLIDHPDKESDNFFYTWLFGALPVKLQGLNVDNWKEVFKNS